jgi:hypothetical protein
MKNREQCVGKVLKEGVRGLLEDTIYYDNQSHGNRRTAVSSFILLNT